MYIQCMCLLIALVINNQGNQTKSTLLYLKPLLVELDLHLEVSCLFFYLYLLVERRRMNVLFVKIWLEVVNI